MNAAHKAITKLETIKELTTDTTMKQICETVAEYIKSADKEIIGFKHNLEEKL